MYSQKQADKRCKYLLIFMYIKRFILDKYQKGLRYIDKRLEPKFIS